MEWVTRYDGSFEEVRGVGMKKMGEEMQDTSYTPGRFFKRSESKRWIDDQSEYLPLMSSEQMAVLPTNPR